MDMDYGPVENDGELESVIYSTLTCKGQLYAALGLAQSKIEHVAKDAKNSFYGYAYASSEAIIEESRKALEAADLVVIPLVAKILAPGDCPQNPDGLAGPNRHSLLVRTFRLAHSSGEYLDSALEWPIVPEKGRPADKATASAMTTQLAYYLRDLLLIPRGDSSDDMDHDSRDHGRDQKNQGQRPAPARSKVGRQAATPAPARHPVGASEPTKAASTGGAAPSDPTVPPAEPKPEPVPGEPGRAIETHDEALDKARRSAHAKAAKWGGYSHDDLKALAVSLDLCEESTNEMSLTSWTELVDFITAEFKGKLAEMYPATEGKPTEQQRIAVVNEMRKQRALTKAGVPEIGADDVPF